MGEELGFPNRAAGTLAGRAARRGAGRSERGGGGRGSDATAISAGGLGDVERESGGAGV